MSITWCEPCVKTKSAPESASSAVLFDLDGTFADTALDLGAALNFLLRQEGRPEVLHEDFRPHTSAGTRGMLRVGFGITPDDAAYAGLAERFLARYAATVCERTCLFEGVVELVTRLEARGLAWGIVTNKPARFTEPLMAALGYGQRAGCIISGDSTPRPKPHPDSILLACERLGVAPAQSWYVGDDLRDIQAGRAAGLKTVAAAWGYLGVDFPIETWAADYTIQQPLHMLDFL